jgi:hypothetical protein
MDTQDAPRAAFEDEMPLRRDADRPVAPPVASLPEPLDDTSDAPPVADAAPRARRASRPRDARAEVRLDASFDEPAPIGIESRSMPIPAQTSVEDSDAAAAPRRDPHQGRARDTAEAARVDVAPERALLVPQPRTETRVVTGIEPRRIVQAPSPAAEADDRPTVRVTIGRVEVRAVMPPPPAPAKSAPATPRLSLGDYLKQRSLGRS